MNPTVVCLVALFALGNAAVLPLEEEAVPYPVLHRQRRGDDPKWFGGGGANGQVQHGTLGFQNPNGSGGKLSYAHANGYGHDVSLDAMVPVWSRQSRYGESTFNVGGGVSHHFGGPAGSQLTDKRVGLSFVHRF